MRPCREIELEGHIIDSGIMTMVFDRIMDMGGEFEILTFNVGKLKTDTSYARLPDTCPLYTPDAATYASTLHLRGLAAIKQ